LDTCGCKYEPILGPSGHYVGGNIIYCPKHAAAPDIFRFLKMMIEYGDGEYNPSPMAIRHVIDEARTLVRDIEEAENVVS
jgi:hypothetical protein